MHSGCVDRTTKTEVINKKIALYSPPFSGINSYYEMVDIADNYGISALEPLNIYELAFPNKEAANSIREYAENKGITIPCLSMFINLAESSREENIKTLREYVDIAAILGAKFFHHTIISEFQNPQNVVPYKDELMEKGIDIVREIYAYAESVGVKTVYEEQGYIFNGIKNFDEFLSRVNCDVGVIADFGNIYQSEDDAMSFVEAFGERVVHVHLKDAILLDNNQNQSGLLSLNGKYVNDAQMGKGVVDFDKCINQLKKCNYNGYYSLEYFSNDDNGKMAEKALAYVNKLI